MGLKLGGIRADLRLILNGGECRINVGGKTIRHEFLRRGWHSDLPPWCHRWCHVNHRNRPREKNFRLNP